MQLPIYVENVIRRLNECGFECYAVGGCVRDSLLGFSPSDWDLCTNAKPQAVQEVFGDVPCIPTGLPHGTVTLLIDGHPLEITTYRTEGAYSDARHPDEVHFVTSLREDLVRRDFTVNAMAYHPDEGVLDFFNGQDDLRHNVLRCVGVATERLREDPLRILRGLRFASCYGFDIEEETAEALHKERQGLSCVARERVREEVNRLLLGKHVADVLLRFPDVIGEVIPELCDSVSFEQHNRYHCYPVYEHSVRALEQADPILTVRLALLLHDVGKPRTFSMDENGCGHFYSHAKVSEAMTHEILTRLRYDKKTIERVTALVRYHDVPLECTATCIKRWLNRLGEASFRELLLVKEGDCRAQSPQVIAPRLEELSRLSSLFEQVLQEKPCFSLKDLAVNGKDVLAQGIPAGEKVGQILNALLDQVIEGKLPNERVALLDAILKNT